MGHAERSGHGNVVTKPVGLALLSTRGSTIVSAVLRACDAETERTLSLLPVLGSRTLRTSLVKAVTEPPTVPLLTTKDLGVLDAFGSAAASLGLTCDEETVQNEAGQENKESELRDE